MNEVIKQTQNEEQEKLVNVELLRQHIDNQYFLCLEFEKYESQTPLDKALKTMFSVVFSNIKIYEYILTELLNSKKNYLINQAHFSELEVTFKNCNKEVSSALDNLALHLRQTNQPLLVHIAEALLEYNNYVSTHFEQLSKAIYN